ncbi:MAG: GNAT family N-acetyltransferase [Chloroflexota bacterium]
MKRANPGFQIVSADQFTIQALTDIYNQTRVDYIVPMPMSATKLQTYLQEYDIDLQQSVVAISRGVPFGIAMLGVRGSTTWITRLGVTPAGRQRGVGQALMEALISNAKGLGARTVVLEVIKNNDPAKRLFTKFGFRATRDLHVIRRPPISTASRHSFQGVVDELGHQDAYTLLQTRPDMPSWVTATQSMKNSAQLAAIKIDLPNTGWGWVVYQQQTLHLSRLVMATSLGDSQTVALALLQHLHAKYPTHDTIIENVAEDDPFRLVYENLGYIPSFTRTEMVRPLKM